MLAGSPSQRPTLGVGELIVGVVALALVVHWPQHAAVVKIHLAKPRGRRQQTTMMHRAVMGTNGQASGRRPAVTENGAVAEVAPKGHGISRRR